MVGHSLSYLKLAPLHVVRTALLGITGHSYLDKIFAFGPALALMTSLYWMATGALKSRHRRPSLAGTSAALALIQTLGFAGQEVLEPAFNSPGEYRAPLMPTRPGDVSFPAKDPTAGELAARVEQLSEDDDGSSSCDNTGMIGIGLGGRALIVAAAAFAKSKAA